MKKWAKSLWFPLLLHCLLSLSSHLGFIRSFLQWVDRGWEHMGLVYRCVSMAGQRRQWQPTPVLLPGKSHGPCKEEPGRLQSMGSLWVGHNWATSLSLLTFMHWRRKWQPTPLFLPGESQGRRSLVGCRLWDRTESDATEVTQQQQQQQQQLHGRQAPPESG